VSSRVAWAALQQHGLPIMQDADPEETVDLAFLKKTH